MTYTEAIAHIRATETVAASRYAAARAAAGIGESAQIQRLRRRRRAAIETHGVNSAQAELIEHQMEMERAAQLGVRTRLLHNPYEVVARSDHNAQYPGWEACVFHPDLDGADDW